MKPLWFSLVLVALLPSVALAQMGWCWDLDEVRGYYQDGLITVVHEATLYNCCPDSFTFEAEQEGSLIRIWEHENLTTPCLCLCCYDLSVTLGSLAPGDYTIEFSWNDYESGDWVVETLSISVPEGNEPGRAEIVGTYASECLETQDVPEQEEPPAESENTWGRVKALFD